jgi:hypothetical protein
MLTWGIEDKLWKSFVPWTTRKGIEMDDFPNEAEYMPNVNSATRCVCGVRPIPAARLKSWPEGGDQGLEYPRTAYMGLNALIGKHWAPCFGERCKEDASPAHCAGNGQTSATGRGLVTGGATRENVPVPFRHFRISNLIRPQQVSRTSPFHLHGFAQ